MKSMTHRMAGLASLLLTGLLSTALLPTGAASAQTMLRDGQVLQGPALSRTASYGEIADKYDCALLSAPQGSRWTIEVTGSRFVRLSQSCAPRGEAVFSASGRSLDFVSGGGTYYVVVGTTDIVGRPSTNGPWSIIARSTPGGGGRRLGPGFTYFAGPAGVASQNAGGNGPPVGEVFRDCPQCPRMAVLPAGSFMMGSPEDEEGREAWEGPRHVVSIGAPFAVGVTEVTFDEYDACAAEGACATLGDGGWGRGRRPVIGASWLDAQRYVGWLSQKTGQKYFLPSEAEWEYAARAGSDTPWNTGSAIIASDANILGQFNRPGPVASYPANGFGLHDMHGNVSEWTQDCMEMGYLGAPSDGSAVGAADCGEAAVMRGGSFESSPVETRSAARAPVSRGLVSASVGFRVVRAL